MDRRGEVVAMLGGLISLVSFVILLVLGATYASLAMYTLAWYVLGAAGIWLLILVQLHQVRLIGQERLELAELDRERSEKLGAATSIFDEEDAKQMDALAMGRRMRTIERWFVPIFAIGVATYLAVFGIRCLPDTWPLSFVLELRTARLRSASMLAFFAGAIAFVTFALSRYALGMSRLDRGGSWMSLRAGGAYFFGVSIASLAAAVALVLGHNGYPAVEQRCGQAISLLMVVVAVEIGINFVLDLYRPRVPGEPQRAFYESRLLSIFSEPEGILRSAARTIDYQFGFKVSETWFYQLLGRAVVPLLLFQAAVLYLATCFVVVPVGHAAVVEKLGLSANHCWVEPPGVTITWPWPFARATLIPVERVRRMELGYDVAQEKSTEADRRKPVLWTQRHRTREYRLLVADRAASADAKVPVNLLSVTMPVHWRVKADRVLEHYLQGGDVEGIVESLAYRELTRYATHADLLDLMGQGGIAAAAALRRSLQAACDRSGVNGRDLGVEIVHVGLGGVHPPVEVADAYENVINAQEQQDTRVKEAYRDAAKTQIEAAGEEYERIYAAIGAEDQAKGRRAGDAEARTSAVERFLRVEAGGKTREITAAAEEYLYRRVILEEASAKLFRIQREMYEKSPSVFKFRAYLKTMTQALKGLRKYVVVVQHPNRVLYQLDLKAPPPLQLLSQEVQQFQEGGGK